jgi:choline dehydrogenase-like flavoprotein
MSIFHLSQAPDHHSIRHAPICIIGAGIAGLLMAVRLGRAGRRVIVIESGLDVFDSQIHDLNSLIDQSGRYTRALTGRYRGFGGTAGHWGGRLVPLSLSDTSSRPYMALQEWPFPVDELRDYTPELEQIFGVDGSSYEEDLLDQIDRDHLFPRADPDLRCRWFKCPTPLRANIGRTLKPEIVRHDGIEVWLGATVSEFVVARETGRLSGIVARNFAGRDLTVTADEFVLAAGAIESTRLLLMLDAATEGRAFQRCSVLGRYFQDHARIIVGTINAVDARKTNRLFGYRLRGQTRRNLHLELTSTAQKTAGIASAYAEIALDLKVGSPLEIARRIFRGMQEGNFAIPAGDLKQLLVNFDYLARVAYWRLAHHQLFMPSNAGLKLEICIEQTPDWSNRIILAKETDTFGSPKVQLEWRLTEADERTFRMATKNVTAYWIRSGFDAICPVTWEDCVHDPSQRMTEVASQRGHPSGSTRMGTDPATSVVDPNLRCHHVPNVRIASSSVFPSSGSANPTLTIMQLAMRTADALLTSTSPDAGKMLIA